jgi:hypothetical protein
MNLESSFGTNATIFPKKKNECYKGTLQINKPSSLDPE